jgi:lipopolysaccharide/colanic/teichoic acid biosynthesis glycosyltransferase
VLFRQTRMGFRGQPFTMVKFRTMAVGSETAGQHFTEEDDPRISRLGRILRRYRLDELPQIINIFRGEMSWIGPRPEAMPLSDWYESQIPFYSYRHIVRPGITGWAQVNQGNVAMIKAATTKLHYDFYYIKHFSPWIELLIAARTVRIVLTGFGSR